MGPGSWGPGSREVVSWVRGGVVMGPGRRDHGSGEAGSCPGRFLLCCWSYSPSEKNKFRVNQLQASETDAGNRYYVCCAQSCSTLQPCGL